MTCKENEPCAELNGMVLSGFAWRVYSGTQPGLSEETRQKYLAKWKVRDHVKPLTVPKTTTAITEYPSVISQTMAVTQATAEWMKAGRPEREEAECKRIHLICETCPSSAYDPKQDRCRACGCGLSINATTSWIGVLGVPDAIKMATHHCPKGHW